MYLRGIYLHEFISFKIWSLSNLSQMSHFPLYVSQDKIMQHHIPISKYLKLDLLLACAAFTFPVNLSLSQTMSFFSLLQFSPPSHPEEWASSSMGLSCQLVLNQVSLKNYLYNSVLITSLILFHPLTHLLRPSISKKGLLRVEN